ncbi:MAG TPA: MFS transporter [Bacillales bacterium]|nr:MFS transporter [Bacillales bacterium]
MNYRQFVTAQSIMMTAGSIVFPFYLLLVKNLGESYAQFGWAYGIFTLTAASVYPWIGKWSDRIGDEKLLLLYTWGMAVLMLTIPLITDVWQVYVVQVVMGMLGAVQKNTEKTFLARDAEKTSAGAKIGSYHFKISLWSAAGVIVAGYLIDFLTIASLFYLVSVLYLLSSFVIWRKNTEVSSQVSGSNADGKGIERL